VDRIRAGKRLGLKVRIGALDPSLTGVSGMAAITELCEQLHVVGALDGAVGPIKQRAVGHSAGQLLAGLAAAQLAGQDYLVGLDRHRADVAGRC
jgi:outer membrane lipoprotein SlyB